jgi:hypothetical protein
MTIINNKENKNNSSMGTICYSKKIQIKDNNKSIKKNKI